MALVALIGWTALLTTPVDAKLLISEILYHPNDPTVGENTLEFVEIYNDEPLPFDVSGYRLEGAISYKIPPGTMIGPRGVLVVALHPDLLAQLYPAIQTPLGPFKGRLDDGGDDVRLIDTGGSVVSRVPYEDRDPWPAAADGAGPSLVLKSPLVDPSASSSWGWSVRRGGSPGSVSFIVVDPEVIINEVFRSDTESSWVELFNPASAEVELDGYRLQGDLAGRDTHVFAPDTRLAARSYLVVRDDELGFRLRTLDQRLYLIAPPADGAGERIVDAHRLEEAVDGTSDGRFRPASPQSSGWQRSPPTPGRANEPPQTAPIVISEIHYHPLSNDPADEFIELANAGEEPVDLSGYELDRGVDFLFPGGTVIEPGAYLVVARDPMRIEQAHDLTGVLGPYRGVLADSGELVRLVDPIGNPVDEILYDDSGSWPRWADGDGPSLELVDLRQENAVGSAWLDSDHASLVDWHAYEYTARQTSGDSELHLFLLGAGEVLVDAIEVVLTSDPDSPNHVPNGDFDPDPGADPDEDPLRAWTIQGTHIDSRLEEGGSSDGSNALRIIASKRGDTRVNRLEIQTTPALRPGAEYTVRFRARWLRGSNLLMTRSWNHGIAHVTRLVVPRLGGTPGRPNSTAQPNDGPVLRDVEQEPPLPAAGEAMIVRVHADDPDGVASVALHHRLDGADRFLDVAMVDDGTNGDRAAGDGEYAAIIDGADRAQGVIAEFYLTATDRKGVDRLEPPLAPDRTYIYQHADGRPDYEIPTYRLVLRDRDYLTLRTRSPHSNHRLPATLVHGDEAIFHQAEVRYRGSPYLRRPSITGLRKGFRVRLRDEKPLRGSVRLTLDEQLADRTFQVDRLVRHWLQKAGGIPYGERRHVHWVVRGSTLGTYEEVLTVDRLYLERAFGDGDDDGELYKIDAHYELLDNGVEFQNPRFTSWAHTTEKEQLRFTYKKRSRESEDDFSALMELLEVMDPRQTAIDEFDARIRDVIDVDLWVKAIAVYRAAEDWDAIGGWTGKNVYLYRGEESRWKLIPWDHDVALGAAALQDDQNARAYLYTPYFPEIRRLLQRPSIDRLFNAELLRLMEEDFTPERVDPVLDRTYELLRTTSGASSPNAIKSFLRQRRAHILASVGRINPETFEITTENGEPFTTDYSPATLNGEAPFPVATIHVNGERAEPFWRTARAWELTIDLEVGENRIELIGLNRRKELIATTSTTITFAPPANAFVRGDVTGDLAIDLADAVRILVHLFVTPSIDCLDAADVDDSGDAESADATYLLGYLFLGGAEPPAPFPVPGGDPTVDGLGCGGP